MARITVYVPDDLKTRMDAAGGNLNWSAITQSAIREAITSQHLRMDPTDMSTVIERLRASKERSLQASEADGQESGGHWARSAAEYDELERIWVAVCAEEEIDEQHLRRLIDADDTMDDHDWEAFWEENGQKSLSDAYFAGFAKGAAQVFAEVKDRL